jgi:ribonuclease HII
MIMIDATSRASSAVPDRVMERDWQACGCRRVAGLDEVGRGPLAGPVVAAAVILPDCDPDWLPRLRDSKQLTAPRREDLARQIHAGALAVGIAFVTAGRIDELGIARASREAMRLAVQQLQCAPDALLLDAFRLPEVDLPQEPVIRGDSRCSAIAAASIVAKVARDRVMDGLDVRFPGYGFSHNRGYGTPKHLDALRRLGPSPLHRFSFAPVALAAGR